MDELKPCPFCGALATLVRAGETYTVKIRHSNDCYLHKIIIPGSFTKEAVVRKWNRRK